MSDAGELKALQDQVDAEKRAVEALQAEYNKALEELRVALEREAQLRAVWAELEGDAHLFES
jgi:hypothetical protein